jgi:LacI family transcriptional regulator
MVRLKQVGIAVPGEIAVVGFNNVPVSRFVEPSLTTIDYPGVEIGEVAASTLIEILKSPGSVTPKTIVLDHRLIVRNSSLQSDLRPERPSLQEKAPVNT